VQPLTSQTQPTSSSSIQPPQQSHSQSFFQPTNYIPYSSQVTEAIASSADTIPPLPAPPEPQPTERREKVAKNYVVHELSQYEGVPQPPWTETMTAMFGDHVKWDELRVYVGKSRPLCACSFIFVLNFDIS
jgi:vacuolar protein sorting-associated protein 72